jgi:predicted acyl esterase
LEQVILHPSSFVSCPALFVRTITRFPHRFTETEECWIPMPDGARLAAKLWLPDISKRGRVPAIIELLPYRKRDIYSKATRASGACSSAISRNGSVAKGTKAQRNRR